MNLDVPNRIVDVVIDTDTFNEVDDQFALAYALRSKERINVVGIYAAPFQNAKAETLQIGMEKSYNEIQHILQLLKREDCFDLVYKGASSLYILNNSSN